jgi:hypothetical protein
MSMKTSVTNPINRGTWALALLGVAVAAMTGDIAYSQPPHRNPQTLTDTVRHATARFRDINVALAEGWMPATPCVSGPDAGAMGVHFAQPSRRADGTVLPDAPQFLIYEPMTDGTMRLVGVEFFVLQSDWEAKNGSGPAVLDGNLMNLIPTPNRYGLPAFYEMHVWAWEDNPKGTYADWNTRVTCDRQADQDAG